VPNVYRYEIRSNGEWGRFLVEEAGMLAICSSYGNYAFTWSAPGNDFRRFLLDSGTDYIEDKLTYQFKGKPSPAVKREMKGFFQKLWPAFREALRKDLETPETKVEEIPFQLLGWTRDDQRLVLAGKELSSGKTTLWEVTPEVFLASARRAVAEEEAVVTLGRLVTPLAAIRDVFPVPDGREDAAYYGDLLGVPVTNLGGLV